MLLINKKINFTQTTFTFMFYYFELFISAVPTKGGIQSMLQKTIFSTLFLAGSVLPITVNLIVLVLIIRRKQLQQVRFYIIANLLLGDIGLLTIQFLRKVIDLYGNQSKWEKLHFCPWRCIWCYIIRYIPQFHINHRAFSN